MSPPHQGLSLSLLFTVQQNQPPHLVSTEVLCLTPPTTAKRTRRDSLKPRTPSTQREERKITSKELELNQVPLKITDKEKCSNTQGVSSAKKSLQDGEYFEYKLDLPKTVGIVSAEQETLSSNAPCRYGSRCYNLDKTGVCKFYHKLCL